MEQANSWFSKEQDSNDNGLEDTDKFPIIKASRTVGTFINDAKPSQREEDNVASTPQAVAEKASPALLTFLQAQRWTILLIGLVVLETALIATALVPAQFWTRILPDTLHTTLDGSFPPTLAPFITTLLYAVPILIGLMCRSWQKALFCATLPAWIGLGVFLVAATLKVGPFYLVSPDHVAANVSILELFA